MVSLSLSSDQIGRSFSRETLSRAHSYAARAVSVADVEQWSAREMRALAFVAGTARQPYVVELEAGSERNEFQISTFCSCPVQWQCKHGAALALVLSQNNAVAPVEPTWEQQLERTLDDLASLAPPDHAPVALALQFSLVAPIRRYNGGDDLVSLRVRPLRQGARQRWVKGGIGWSDVPGAVGARRHDPDQLRILGALHGALTSSRAYWQASADPAVDDFGPSLIGLLGDALEAGIEFVVERPLTGVDICLEPLSVTADIVVVGDTSEMRLGVSHGGRLWRGAELVTLGSPAHSIALVDGTRMTLASLERPLPTAVSALLADERPVVVPATGAEVLPGYLMRLGRLVTVTSSDASVPLPRATLPRLRVTVIWESATEADVRWEWAYDDQTVALDSEDTLAGLRDRSAERALLSRLPDAVQTTHRLVDGPAVLHLAHVELPAWRGADDISVVEVHPPHFHEAESAPEITIETTEPADGLGETTDWLDLSVGIRIDGEPLLLVQLLEALTLGHDHLVLRSGLFVRTDRPEFAQLHDIVRAAAELKERDGDTVKVGRHDLGLWAQLAELGVVDEQAQEWVRRAQALRDLTEIPRPEPTGVVSTLRSYQLDGFHWLAFLWQHDLGGILADDMGLGKTLQVLALVQHTRATDSRPFLVVAPTSVVSAWLSEAARHTPALRIAAVTSSGRRRQRSIADIAADVDVVVTTYTLLRLDAEQYADVEWGGLVLDEAQQVKNHESKAYSAVRKIDAPFRLAVTGTPFENRLLELWSLLSITVPGLYPWPKSFLQNVARPVEKEGDAAALRRFRQRIRPFMLRRTKEVVAADLPPKQEQVLDVELSPRHRRIYDTHLAKERQRILGLVDDFDRNRVAILAALTTLRQLALDPALVDPDHEAIGSAKLDLLVEHLREITAEGHRALVFSQFTGFLRRVRQRLADESIPTVYLDGTTRRRGEVIEEFRSGDAPVFLISLKAGGVGLTLTEADYVFVLDPWWNPAAEAQAVDRAHRIGQQRTVMVYRLVSAGTIEEKVMALKARKSALFSQVIDGNGAPSGTIDADDIRALFED